MAAYPVTHHPAYKLTTATRKYWWEGGIYLDQGNTGTCVYQAVNHRFADSPVPQAGISEAIAQHDYVAGTGDSSMQNGTSGLNACRYYMGTGKITSYYWVTSPEELRNAVLTIGAVCVGTIWTDPMFSPKVKYGTGRAYLEFDPSSHVAGGHEYDINGINLTPSSGPPFYRMKNSWGLQWPGDANPGVTLYGPGTARIACTQLESLVFDHGGDAVVIVEKAA